MIHICLCIFFFIQIKAQKVLSKPHFEVCALLILCIDFISIIRVQIFRKCTRFIGNNFFSPHDHISLLCRILLTSWWFFFNLCLIYFPQSKIILIENNCLFASFCSSALYFCKNFNRHCSPILSLSWILNSLFVISSFFNLLLNRLSVTLYYSFFCATYYPYLELYFQMFFFSSLVFYFRAVLSTRQLPMIISLPCIA